MASIALSCTPSVHPVKVSRVLIDLHGDATQGRYVTRQQLREIVEDAVAKSSQLRLSSGDEGYVLRVALVGSKDGNEKIRLYLRAKVGKNPQNQFRAGEVVEDASLNTIKESVKDVFGQIDLLLKARNYKTEVLLDSLDAYLEGKSKSRKEILRSITILGDRKEQIALSPLSKLLLNKNRKVAAHAVLALGKIGDESVIDDVILYSERKSPAIRQIAIQAARNIGGKKAAAWLFTLSTGHNNEGVRKAAKDALLEIEARLADG